VIACRVVSVRSVAEVTEVEHQEVVADPRADAEHGAVVLAFGGDLDRLLADAAHAHDGVRLERGLGVVGPARW